MWMRACSVPEVGLSGVESARSEISFYQRADFCARQVAAFGFSRQ